MKNTTIAIDGLKLEPAKFTSKLVVMFNPTHAEIECVAEELSTKPGSFCMPIYHDMSVNEVPDCNWVQDSEFILQIINPYYLSTVTDKQHTAEAMRKYTLTDKVEIFNGTLMEKPQ